MLLFALGGHAKAEQVILHRIEWVLWNHFDVESIMGLGGNVVKTKDDHSYCLVVLFSEFHLQLTSAALSKEIPEISLAKTEWLLIVWAWNTDRLLEA